MSLYPATITSAAAQDAMQAHANINWLGSLIALCESSLGTGPRMHEVERKIITLCKREAAIQLRLMDKATGRKEQP